MRGEIAAPFRTQACCALLVALSACMRPAAGQVMRLSSGDSVRVLGTGPAIVPNEKPGLLVDYNPFLSLDDTVALKREALALWSALRPRIDSLNPPFVVLRATTRKPQLIGYQSVRNYGFVLEKRPDGKWYFLHEPTPVDGQ